MDAEKIIMGIDPGTNILGFGVISVCKGKASFVDMGIVDMRKEPDHFKKLALIASEIALIMDNYAPTELAIESAFYAKDAQVIQKLGRAQGIVIAEAIKRFIPVFEYAPRKAKIAVTGNGAASKEQVAVMIQRQLGLKELPKHLDATDALGIALCHFHEQQSPLGKISGGGDWKSFIASHQDRIVK